MKKSGKFKNLLYKCENLFYNELIFQTNTVCEFLLSERVQSCVVFDRLISGKQMNREEEIRLLLFLL